MSRQELVEYVRENHIGLVGIGAMTRMIRKAYQMADAVRAAGVPVVMGGPHVTEVPDEPLGRDGEPRHADAIALGEADQTWPAIVADAERGALKEIYAPLGSLKAMLRDHFNLALHPEVRNLPVYDLVVDKNGSKLRETSGPGRMRLGRGELAAEGTPLPS